MNRRLPISRLLLLLAVLALIPTTAVTYSTASAAPAQMTSPHQLPHSGSSAGTTLVFAFGTKGGSLRPTTINISLDGSISVNGAGGNATLAEPRATLKGLMTLAEAESFFSMRATVGCLGAAGNPDVSAQFITIHTSTGTKKVQRYGACNSHFGQLYAVLQAVTASAR